MPSDFPALEVSHAQGVHIELADGRQLIDGMASWWCMIHGYNHPVLNAAIQDQLGRMAHVMFGGLTHQPAAELAHRLVGITPAGLNNVFFADSGSVAVEVALKMALQYWQSRGQHERSHFVSLRSGYHGDTFGAMSVCDPVTGMHQLFSGILPRHHFVPAPPAGLHQVLTEADLEPLETLLQQHHRQLAAMILEPVLQGAGGMRIYSLEYLQAARQLCDQYEILLIADEIATGFGRTGKLFACEWADISPDILCLGKALTGGYMTLAATLCNDMVRDTICGGDPGVFMHGPTFMANPLACSVANASIDLLLRSDWSRRIESIESQLVKLLQPARELELVEDIRVLGAVGVIETRFPVNMAAFTRACVDLGVWLRPFGQRIYCMPPYSISPDELAHLGQAMVELASQRQLFNLA